MVLKQQEPTTSSSARTNNRKLKDKGIFTLIGNKTR
jgi:hypothetical protein